MHDWPVLGLHIDLAARYPVGPLRNATNAQAELALAGIWAKRPAMVAATLVRPAGSTPGRRRPDQVVQLTTLETGSGAHEVSNGRDGLSSALAELLSEAAIRSELLRGDQVAAAGTELVHARQLRPLQRAVDIQGPLRLLSCVAVRLG